tara:strand:- start:426 stop:731 length:306 start_codon:yes stop_codon:yes gene_type:complete
MSIIWKNINSSPRKTTITVDKKLKEIELHKRALQRASGFFLMRPLPFQHRTWTQLEIFEYVAKNVSSRYEDLTPTELMSHILDLTNEFKSFLKDGKELGGR